MKHITRNRTLTVVLCPDVGILQRPSSEFPRGDVILFSELVDGGYRALTKGEGRHSINDDFVHRFRQLSRDVACTCIGGTVALVGVGARRQTHA